MRVQQQLAIGVRRIETNVCRTSTFSGLRDGQSVLNQIASLHVPPQSLSGGIQHVQGVLISIMLPYF